MGTPTIAGRSHELVDGQLHPNPPTIMYVKLSKMKLSISRSEGGDISQAPLVILRGGGGGGLHSLSSS